MFGSMCAHGFLIWKYSTHNLNHLNDTPSTKAARDGIFSGVFQQGRQGTRQGQEDFELSWYLFFQQGCQACTKSLITYVANIDSSYVSFYYTEVLCM